MGRNKKKRKVTTKQPLAKKQVDPPKPQATIPIQDQPNRSQVSIRAEHYEGPLPPPALLRQYNEIVENGADRIFVILENQVSHRSYLERAVIDRDNRRADWGVICAFVICICFLVSGSWLVSTGHDTAGGVIATTGIAGIAGTFIYGTNSRRSERESKREKAQASTKLSTRQ